MSEHLLTLILSGKAVAMSQQKVNEEVHVGALTVHFC